MYEGFNSDGKKLMIPRFAEIPLDGSFWPLIIEKAWGKLYGNMNRTTGGHGAQSLYMLTGAPIVYRSKTDKDTFTDYNSSEIMALAIKHELD